MSGGTSSTTYVVNRLSGSDYYEWYGPDQDSSGTGLYSDKMSRYSSAGDIGLTIQVHNFSTLDNVSGTWTVTSAVPIRP